MNNKITRRIKPLENWQIEELRWEGFRENVGGLPRHFLVGEDESIEIIKEVYFPGRHIAMCLYADENGGEVYGYRFEWVKDDQGRYHHKVIEYLIPEVLFSHLILNDMIKYE